MRGNKIGPSVCCQVLVDAKFNIQPLKNYGLIGHKGALRTLKISNIVKRFKKRF